MEGFLVEVFFDGACSICVREIASLRALDRHARIKFTDISATTFDPTALGLTFATMMEKIHGRLPSGEIVSGVEVFRHLYDAVGLGPLVAISRLPVVADALDKAYEWFSRNRLRLTGRCADGSCAVPHGRVPA